MKKKRNMRLSMAFKTFLLVTVLCGDRMLLLQPAIASNSKEKEHHSKHEKYGDTSASPVSLTQIDPILGVDGATLKLINEGKWQEATIALEAQTAGSKTADKKEAWLAFTYLYLNNCAKLSVMNDRMGATASMAADVPKAGSSAVIASTTTASTTTASTTTGLATTSATTSTPSSAGATSAPSASTTSTVTTTSATAATPAAPATPPAITVRAGSNRYAIIISAFERVCEGRRDDAFALIQQLPTDAVNDPICLFADAAISSKRGMVADAANLCIRVVALAPNFAWGYRTLGFLQQFSLKRPLDAEISYQKALIIEPDLDSVRRGLIQMKVARNDYDGAIEIARALIATHPTEAAAHYQLADEILIKQWRFLEASAQLDDAIRFDPNNAKYYRAQAAVKRLQGDLPGALLAQQMAVKLGTDKAFELVELASLEQLSGNNTKAVDDLEQSIALDPNNTTAHEKLIGLLEASGRFDALVSEYSRLLKDKPKDAKLHLRLAKALANTGKIEEAEKEFVEAANLDPTDAEPHRQMGLLKIQLRQFGSAAKEYTRALNINPSSVPDLVSLGYCYAENDDYMQAEAAYVTSLALQQLLVQTTDVTPDRLDIMRSLAILLLHESRYGDAAGQFESIIAMHKPGTDVAPDQFMLARSRALRDLTTESAKNLQAAFDKLDEQKRANQSMWLVDTFLRMNRPDMAKTLIETHRNDPADTDSQCSWLEAVGRYDLETNNADSARTILNKIVDSKTAGSSLKSLALKTIADGAYASGDYASAEKNVRQAVDIYPKNFQANVLAGRVALKNKEWKLAGDFAKKALETNPYDAGAQVVTAQAQIQLGDLKGAVVSLKKAIALYPALVEAHKVLAETLTKQGSAAEAKKESDLAATLEAQQK